MKLNEYGHAKLESAKREKYGWTVEDTISKYSFKTIHFLSTILASNTDTFYAKDFNIDGGTMNALSNIALWIKNKNGRNIGRRYLILPTDNTKKEMVNLYENHYIEVEVNEWKINKELARDFIEFYKEAINFALGG